MSRVLFSACDGYGHVYPLLPLAAAFRCLGDEVLIATGPDLAPVVAAHGFDSHSVGGTLAEAEREFLMRHPEAPAFDPVTRLGLVAAEMFVGVAAHRRMPDLVRLIEQTRPDLVVHDASELAAPVAAARAGTPAVAHAVSILNPSEQAAAAVRPRLSELGAAWGVDGAADRLLAQPYLDICPPALASPMTNPFADVRAVRPQLLPTPAATVPAEVRALPYERTVLVTLGTVVHRTPGVLETMVDAVEDLPVNLVVTVGPGGDPARLGSRPRHVHVAQYLPFEALIPRCTAVVAHAGAGTLLGALAAGVPSVLVPQGAEQVANALAAQEAGAGIALLLEAQHAAAVRAALVEVLANPSFRQGAHQLRREIASMPSAPLAAIRLRREGFAAVPVESARHGSTNVGKVPDASAACPR